MVQNSHWLPLRKAARCRLIGTVFLLFALAMPPAVVSAGLTPGASPYCAAGEGCVWKSEPTVLLNEEDRVEVGASPAAQRKFAAYVARSDVRLALAAVEAIQAIPLAILLIGVGLALRRLGGRGADALPQTLRWLRRASVAAIVWALANPVHETLLETLLSPGTPSGATVQVTLYLGDIATGLLFALASYAAIWALEAGLRAQRDLDDFV